MMVSKNYYKMEKIISSPQRTNPQRSILNFLFIDQLQLQCKCLDVSYVTDQVFLTHPVVLV